MIDAVNARGYGIKDHNEADALALMLYVESNEWPIRGFTDLFLTADERRREFEEIWDRASKKAVKDAESLEEADEQRRKYEESVDMAFKRQMKGLL